MCAKNVNTGLSRPKPDESAHGNANTRAIPVTSSLRYRVIMLGVSCNDVVGLGSYCILVPNIISSILSD